MDEMWELRKKIKKNTYEIADLEKGFNYDSHTFLFRLMYEIAKTKMFSDKILESLRELVYGHREVSKKGAGSFTVGVTACAALIKLGFTEEYESLDKKQQKWIGATLNDSSWKSL